MKVALLLTGQPRCALETCEIIKKLIIDPNNADVFMHMWYDENDLYMEKAEKDRGETELNIGIDKMLIKFYNPKSFIIEKQKFKNFNNYNNDYFKVPEKIITNVNNNPGNKKLSREDSKLRLIRYSHLSQFYSNYKCNELKELYSLENNVYYDYVIKLRYDCTTQIPLICKNYNPDKIYYQTIGQPDNLISDWFNMGSNEIMNIYASIFLYIKYLNNSNGFYNYNDRQLVTTYNKIESVFTPEYLIRDLMYKLNIPADGINLGFRLQKKS